MPTIYMDTSVAIHEAFLKSAYVEPFLKACAILNYTVIIPEIVLDEIIGNFPKKLNEKLAAFNKNYKEMAKLLSIDFPIVSISDETSTYNEWLDNLISEYNITIAPYPQISNKELVEQSYLSKKPFKDSGEGHKDYLVFKTIYEQIQNAMNSSPHIFLTNNTKDFCVADDEGNYNLHPDLKEQIENPSLVPSIYTSVKGVFDAELAPKLEGISLEDIPDLGTHDIDTMVGDFLLEDLPRRSLFGLEGVPFSNEISIASIGHHSIEEVSLKKAGDEVVINITGEVEVEIDGFVNKFDFFHDDHEDSKIYIVDRNWNDHVMMVSSSVSTEFEMAIFYSIDMAKVSGYEISLPQEIEDEWPYK